MRSRLAVRQKPERSRLRLRPIRSSTMRPCCRRSSRSCRPSPVSLSPHTRTSRISRSSLPTESPSWRTPCRTTSLRSSRSCAGRPASTSETSSTRPRTRAARSPRTVGSAMTFRPRSMTAVTSPGLGPADDGADGQDQVVEGEISEGHSGQSGRGDRLGRGGSKPTGLGDPSAWSSGNFDPKDYLDEIGDLDLTHIGDDVKKATGIDVQAYIADALRRRDGRDGDLGGLGRLRFEWAEGRRRSSGWADPVRSSSTCD